MKHSFLNTKRSKLISVMCITHISQIMNPKDVQFQLLDKGTGKVRQAQAHSQNSEFGTLHFAPAESVLFLLQWRCHKYLHPFLHPPSQTSTWITYRYPTLYVWLFFSGVVFFFYPPSLLLFLPSPPSFSLVGSSQHPPQQYFRSWFILVLESCDPKYCNWPWEYRSPRVG